jgi:RNA polymerase sigma-70 factor (ECF subfamily)
MVDAYAVGQRAWPELELDPQRFRAHLDTRGLTPDMSHAADLYLACACLHGLPRALAAFDSTLLARIATFVAKLRPTDELITELKQVMREELFTGAAPKIRDYSGKGPLAAWLRVVALRAALKLKRDRGEQRLPREPHDVALTRSSPELQALRNRYRPLFSDAFHDALAELTTDERNLLRLHFVDGLSMDALGKLFRVNRSTVFRRLNSCTAALNRAIRVRVGEQLGVSTSEFESLAQLIASDLEVSLSGLLRSQH